MELMNYRGVRDERREKFSEIAVKKKKEVGENPKSVFFGRREKPRRRKEVGAPATVLISVEKKNTASASRTKERRKKKKGEDGFYVQRHVLTGEVRPWSGPKGSPCGSREEEKKKRGRRTPFI